MAGADQHDTAVKVGLQRLGHLGDGRRAVAVLVYVLLDFVEDDEGERQFPIGLEGLPGRVGELWGRDVGIELGKLAVQDLTYTILICCKVWVGLKQSAANVRTDIQIVEFLEPFSPGTFDRRSHGVEPALVAQPEAR